MLTDVDLLGIADSCRLLGVSADTLRRLVRREVLPEHRDDKGNRHYRREDLESLRQLRAHRILRKRSVHHAQARLFTDDSHSTEV